MSDLLRFGGDRKGGGRGGPVRFDRGELKRLLSLYSRRVADGEWRDYAIALQPGQAIFAVFRSSFDRPLYTITKHGETRRDRKGFEVSSGPRRLSAADTLEEALAVFDRHLRLVVH